MSTKYRLRITGECKQNMKPAQKGVYIHQGRKIVVK